MRFSRAGRRVLASIPLLHAIVGVGAAPTQGIEHPSAADFYVPTLPGLAQDPYHPINIYAGHIVADPSQNVATPSKTVLPHLYFVLLKARRTADRERLVIWFNGGPGCSSFDGLMMETGPWRMDGKGGLKRIDGGWDEYAHVLYLDQPPGTGFSYASTDSYLHELDAMAAHVSKFLSNFYEVFPEMKHVDTYLAGESFAGQYIPYVADAILKTTMLPTQLKGIAIGNGWIDGRYQYPAYYDFAIKAGLFKESSKDAKRARDALARCNTAVQNITQEFIPVNINGCEAMMNTVTDGLRQTIDGKHTCLNVYDVRLSDEFPACGMNWPPDLAGVTEYLGRKDVVRALHATDKSESWTECRGDIYAAFNVRHSQASVTLLPGILDKIPVLLFAGDQDLICNYVGVESTIDHLEWKGSTGFGDAPVLPWKLNGTDVGSWRTARNLTYVKVFGASHMVGFDVPMVAHDMILRFMGVDFSLASTTGAAAKLDSVIGDDVRPAISVPSSTNGTTSGPTEVSEQDKARWEAYYNAGSAALIFILIILAIGLFIYFRRRSRFRKSHGVILAQDEETIPLHANGTTMDGEDFGRRRKGKAKETYPDSSPVGEPIFDVGEDEDSGDERTPAREKYRDQS